LSPYNLNVNRIVHVSADKTEKHVSNEKRLNGQRSYLMRVGNRNEIDAQAQELAVGGCESIREHILHDSCSHIVNFSLTIIDTSSVSVMSNLT
jgi:hypothetical protein